MSTQLVTLAEYKIYREKSENEEMDARLNIIIDSVSELVKTYCNRTLIDYVDTEKIEYFDATSTGEYYTREMPIIEVISLSLSTDGGVTYTVAEKYSDYFVDKEHGKVLTGTQYNFSRYGIGHNSAKLVYKGGYVNVPKDLKLAVMDLVKYYEEEEYTPRKAFAGMTIENVGFRDGASTGLPSHIKRVLELYRIPF